MSTPKSITPAGHVASPVAAIGSMAALLAAGMGAVGLLGRVDGMIGQSLAGVSPPGSAVALPIWLPWVGVVAGAFVVPLVLLEVAGSWRRVVLWVSALGLVAGWAPVLALASRMPEVSGTFIATFWSGLCSLVYASRHRMPCDALSETRSVPSRPIS
jgi:hypothetical protein